MPVRADAEQEPVGPGALRTAARPVLLALRALKLGDLLVAVPALRGLRRGFPEHEIVLAAPAWLAPIVQLVDAVDELLPTPGLDDALRVARGSVDVAVNLHGSGDESRRRVDELGARLLIAHRTPNRTDGLPWLAGLHERERWVRLVSAYGIAADASDLAIAVPAKPPPVSGAAVVHVGAAYRSREWPADRFARVARELSESGLGVVLTGGEPDRERALSIARGAGLHDHSVLAGSADLTAFAGVVASAKVLVTVDTGAAHLASAYGTPSVVLFGPAPPEAWGPPPGGPHVVLTDPRLRRGDAFADRPDPALLAVTSDEVIDAVRSLLHATGEELTA